MKIVTAEQMRELDRRTIQEGHVSGLELMERAGIGVFSVAQTMTVAREHGVALFVGKGNNGGDAIVAAEHLYKAGRGWGPITLVLTSAPEEFSSDALYYLKKLTQLRPRIVHLDPNHKEPVAELLVGCGLIVDGLLGTGARGEPLSPVREAIELINAAKRPTLAIDIPSGMDANTGQTATACVRADVTATIGLPKCGLLQQVALDNVGRLAIVDIGIPSKFTAVLPPGRDYFMLEDARTLLPSRRPSAHKGDFGHLLMVAGSEGYTGAAVLCSQAAMRSGVGLVTLAVPRAVWPIVASQCCEVMPRPFDPAEAGPEALAPMLEKCDALAIGPGLGQSKATESVVHWLLQNCAKPMVIDADALNVLANNPARLRNARGPVVITPHPGEMGRLTGTSTGEVQSDRWGCATGFAAESKAVVVLKGSRTVVANPAGDISVNSTGNPGMASGGVGDVLTGVIGALLAQNFSAFDAARLSVWMHGFAGDIATQEIGEEALIASDVISHLGAAFRRLRQLS
ncbi:MAG: NAD(P)H-hydrate dehydratase [Verrucomicrobia bacterium]|nr:NAD(P)H-hydrate dehydratase [Verrucomicrobiota bacterium]